MKVEIGQAGSVVNQPPPSTNRNQVPDSTTERINEMTRKDYVAIATAIRREYDLSEGRVNRREGIRATTDAIATALQGNNSGFDRAKFLSAALGKEKS